MGKLISLAEYAALHNRAAISVRQKARRGGFQTAKKIGRNWVIESDEPYEDNRHGSTENIVRPRTCRQCGKEFQGGPRAWYCPECREQRRKNSDRSWQRDKRAGIPTGRLLGSIDHCEICGKEYIVKSSRQRYCLGCADEAVKAVDRNQSLKYYVNAKSTDNPIRNERRRVKGKICVVCGKEFPCDGTSRNTCSPECAKKQQQGWQRNADKKRRK